jgi:hypothetical protein
MRLISHRGAKAYGQENSISTIKIASQLNVEFIEIDIRYTKNNIVVLHHDAETSKGNKIKDYTYRTLQREASYMPTLSTALREASPKAVLIDSKAEGSIAKSLEIIKNYPNVAITSKLPQEILSARINLPRQKTYLIKSLPVFGILKQAKAVDASGIGISVMWLPLIPYYYYLAQKNHLDIFIYTLDVVPIAKLIAKLMPKILIVTNDPKKMLGLNEH